ncbi:hypothetical protein HAX54_039630 [Datura stramonium]|uniref:Uncharacterized protein n=1 Tax=Datura stramonium TaxID=4076 RepID=A0ABS8VNY0_DATST|nr:hypothetical protein [Datura stramonium]
MSWCHWKITDLNLGSTGGHLRNAGANADGFKVTLPQPVKNLCARISCLTWKPRDTEVFSYATSIKLMNEMWRREEERDAALVKIMIQIGLLAKCMRGFHRGYQGANQGSQHPHDENQGIQELKGDLFEFTRMLKDHEISIRHLEERMSHLTSQMKSWVSVEVKKPLVENVPPSSKGVDEEDIEQDIEETFLKESLEAILLNNDGEDIEG